MYQSADFLSSLGAEPERGRPRKKAKTAKTVSVQRATLDPLEGSSWMAPIGPFLKRNARELMIGLGISTLVGTAMVNAVFLQSAKHPAPLFERQEVHVASKGGTAVIPKSREIILAQEAGAPAVDPIVREMQQQLAARGYYNSEFDGLMGARTRAAIGVYQRAFGIPVSNEASRALLEHIRLSITDNDYHAKARERVAEAEVKVETSAPAATTQQSDLIITDPQRIKQVQQALSRLGFNLVADGVAGRNTNLAIVEFKKRQGLEPSEHITLAIFNELIKLKKL